MKILNYLQNLVVIFKSQIVQKNLENISNAFANEEFRNLLIHTFKRCLTYNLI